MDHRPDPPGERIVEDQYSFRATDLYDEDPSSYAAKNEADDDDEDDAQSKQANPEEDEESDEESDDELGLDNDANPKVEASEETQLDGEPMQTDETVGESTEMDETALESSPQEEADPLLDFVPDCSKADSLPFSILCRRLDILWQHRTRKTNRQTKDALWDTVMPDSLRRFIGRGSFFPLLRLLMPDLDTSRPHTGMKERYIAIAWADALGFQKTTRVYRKLLAYNDPSVAGPTAAGDLSLVLYEVLQERYKSTPSSLTVGQVNKLLDELVEIKNGSRRAPHDWRETQYTQTQTQSYRRSPRKDTLRQRWVEKLLGKTENPLEHKWIVRIILQRLDFGFGSKTVLSRYYPVALDLYKMNNNLKSVCTTLCNPEWWKQHKAQEAKKLASVKEGHYMEEPSGSAILGNTIAPMLAQRTTFASALADLSRVHREYAKNLSRDDPKRTLLPLKFPAFCGEVKLDGERIIAHIKRGQVTMQTRRAVWYSLRRAIENWDVDVMLDGEVIAWDDAKSETIPFGNNRPVALARRKWMESQGLVDSRDLNLHNDQRDLNVMRFGHRDTGAEENSGSKCFLKYMVFDVLYVGGPDASRLLSQSLGTNQEEAVEGSIIHLNGFQRKRVLHRLLAPQKNEVEFVPALVVRPNGTGVNADQYFSATHPSMDDGHLASDLDSISYTFQNAGAGMEHIQESLKCSMSDAELSKRRTESADQFYSEIVDKRALEGVVFKDLNSCYLLDGRKYWFKHKPENEDISHASDIDLLILGGFYATGFGPSGLLNSFLLGCVDQDNPETFLTVCKINGGGIDRETQKRLLDETGYQKQTAGQEWDSGKWFKEVRHGRTLPDFISKRSFQHQDVDRGPVLEKSKYPDLWIHPEDSVILTVKAGEIVVSESFSAGVTLRFPRIEKVRLKFDGDAKKPQDVESVKGLQQLFRETLQLREGSGSIEVETGSPAASKSRFQTPEDHLRKKATRRNLTNNFIEWQMPIAEKKDSSALEGLSIVVLEGTYRLAETSLDAEEAKEQGWWDHAKHVKSRDDVLLFISSHGGTPKTSVSSDTNFIVGGRPDDARVVVYERGLAKTLSDKKKTRSKTGLSLEDMMRIGSIRKWTFVYSIVHEWIRTVSAKRPKDESTEGEQPTPPASTFGSSILTNHQHLLRPGRHHFLRSSSSTWDEDNNVLGISLSKNVTPVDFKRGLQNAKIQMNKRQKTDILPWQFAAMQQLPATQRWIVGTSRQKLWPYGESGLGPVAAAVVVMYPDLFGNDFGMRSHDEALADVLSGDSDRLWSIRRQETDAVASALPLARVMGVQLVPHLTNEVTHVLCSLVGDYQMVTWDSFDAEKFANPKHARRMRVRLSGAQQQHKPVFVSPSWIRHQWGQAPSN